MTIRYLKHLAHVEFDRLWKEGLMSRTGAYNYLRYLMGIVEFDGAHIGKLSYGELGVLLKRLRNPY